MNSPSTVARQPISGIAQWHTCFRALLHDACAQSSQRLVLCAQDWRHWPLSETDVIQTLEQWLRPSVSMVILTHDFEALERLHPRFVAWRQRWDQYITGRKTIKPYQSETPCFTLSDQYAIWLTNPALFTGMAGSDRALYKQVAEQADEWLTHRAVNAFAANTLGL
ncbi:hypothetical protein E9531_08670 [Lampropedia puyangensis]|uniref:Uncharacterized protein n=1 Tax=Lampropedia puyangensis TaxID=1330072 RepID=A0A4V4GRJ8_9BURK|nr:hypothetical protein [Lampropedia puyangensis]THU02056.1 hypothetical protein E9531_08670 [Lampropedia puyangensis]